MSRLHDRLSDCVRYEITTAAAVMLWNHFAEKHSYECIYNMKDFDEIVGVDRSYRDVMNDLSHGFDQNAGYFYADSSDGTWASTDNPFVVMDLNLLVKDLIDSEGHGYPSVSAVDEYFDGYLFEVEMKSVLDRLSPEEFPAIAGEELEPENPKESAYARLEEIFLGDDFAPVYMMPEAVQDKFFELKNPNIEYLQENIGKVNEKVPVEKALELAGFDHFEKDAKDIYVFRNGNSFERFHIKIKNGAIKSAEPAHEKKQTSCR